MDVRRKLEPLKVEDWPDHLQDQVRNYNSLLVQDEFHREREMSPEEEIKWLEARVKLHKAKAALLDARVRYCDGNTKEAVRDYWKKIAESYFKLALALVALYFTWARTGIDMVWFWVMVINAFFFFTFAIVKLSRD